MKQSAATITIKGNNSFSALVLLTQLAAKPFACANEIYKPL